MVKVLPEPVTPSSTWSRSWARTPLSSSSIACGWSPFGSNSDTTRKRRPPSDLSGRGGRCGSHGGRVRMLGSPSSQSALSESAVTAAPVRPRGWLSGAGVSNLGCGASPNPCVLGTTRAGLSNSARCSPSGWTSGREALDLGPEDLGPGADFRGAGMSGIWGDSSAGERASAEALPPRLDRGWSSRVVVHKLRYVIQESGLRQAVYFSGDLWAKGISADPKGHSGQGTLASVRT